MDSFVQALRDGFIVLGENWQLVLVVLSLVVLGQSLMDRLLGSIFGDHLLREAYFLLGSAGWLVPACLLSIVWFALRATIFPQLHGGIFIFLLAVLAVVLVFRLRTHIDKPRTIPWKSTLLFAVVFLCISIPLRLAFISDLAMPLYFDSTRHYAIIQGMLDGSGTPAAAFPSIIDYYHVGFHLVAALIASSLEISIAQTILVLGQMIIAVAPLSVFFLIQHITGSKSAAIFAVLLAGFGWSMPAYALNWGKYPAVTSLALIPFVLSMLYLAVQSGNELPKQKQRILYTVLACATAACGILHSRALVAITIAGIAWILAGWWLKRSRQSRGILSCALLTGIVLVGLLIDRQDVFDPLFNPYLRQGRYVTATIFLLSAFAFQLYPRWTFASLAAIFFLLCALFVPTLDLIPRLADRTLLDRPFVEMLLYLPLSLLGGFGISGLGHHLRHASTYVSAARISDVRYLSVLPIVLLIGNAVLHYDLHPSDCCSIIDRDDMQAMEWIRSYIPADARILIAADELTVAPSSKVKASAPTDAGAWITSLTGRATVPLSYDTNLDKDPKFESLCSMEIDYIYVGGVGLSFYAPRIRSNPEWYTSVFSRSRVEIYQVIGCR